MLWIKAFHIIFVVTWFAGLFYLPRLFVYHADTTDSISIERFKIMERRLFYGITTPSGILATLLGIWLLSYNIKGYMSMGWMHAKLGLIVVLWMYHIYCGVLVKRFKLDNNRYSSKFYRWFNEFSVLVFTVIYVH